MATLIGPYALFEPIAMGGMAEVWLARALGEADEAPGPWCAVKRLFPHLAEREELVELLRHEAELGARCAHPGLLLPDTYLHRGATHAVVMPYVPGVPLSHVIASVYERGRMLSVAMALAIVRDVARALHALHHATDEHGEPLRAVHGDISHHNILIGRDGRVVLIDLGVAQSALLPRPHDGTLRGKIAYMSPEQASGEPLDARSDLFSLGIVLWELLTAQQLYPPPEDPTTHEAAVRLMMVSDAKVRPPREVVPELAPDLNVLVMRMLSREPGHRFQSGAEVAVALEQYLEASGVGFTRGDLASWMAQHFAGTLARQQTLLARHEEVRTVDEFRAHALGLHRGGRAQARTPASVAHHTPTPVPAISGASITASTARDAAPHASAAPEPVIVVVTPAQRRVALRMRLAAVLTSVTAILLGLTALLVYQRRNTPGAPPHAAPARLVVTTTPASARIVVNGTPCVAPCTRALPTTGPHHLVVRHDAHAPDERIFSVEPGELRTIHVTLTRVP